MTWLAAAREIVETSTAAEVDGVLLDLFSASAMVEVHDALNTANAERFAAMPLPRAHDMAFALINKQRSS